METREVTMNPIMIYTDGGARGNPGPAAIGVVIGDRHFKEYIGETTNNVAEYKAVIFALRESAKILGNEAGKANLVIHTDSELIARQMTGKYKVKQEHLKILKDEATKLMDPFGKVSFEIIRREANTVADGLVNAALDER